MLFAILFSLSIQLGLGFEYASLPPVLVIWDAAGISISILLIAVFLSIFGLYCIFKSIFLIAILFTIIPLAIVPVILVIIVFRIVAIVWVAKVERVELLISDAVVALDVPVFFLLQYLVRGVLLVYLVRSNLRCVLQVGNRSNDAYSRAQV